MSKAECLFPDACLSDRNILNCPHRLITQLPLWFGHEVICNHAYVVIIGEEPERICQFQEHEVALI